MTQSELAAQINILTPGAQWAISGDKDNALYSEIVWLDKIQAQPTAQALGF